jgi:predicted transcriptional regulator
MTDMKLNDNELEILHVLWKSDEPLAATDLREAVNHKWHDKYIYVILKSLFEKKLIVKVHYKPTATNNAGTYAPAISAEEYAAKHLCGLTIDMAKFEAAYNYEKSKKAEEEAEDEPTEE